MPVAQRGVPAAACFHVGRWLLGCPDTSVMEIEFPRITAVCAVSRSASDGWPTNAGMSEGSRQASLLLRGLTSARPASDLH